MRGPRRSPASPRGLPAGAGARGRACGRRALLAPLRFCGGHQPPAGAIAGGSCSRGRAESRAGAAGRASAPAGALPRGAPHRAGTSLPVARGRALGRARRVCPHLPTRSEAPAPRGALVAGAGTSPPLAPPPAGRALNFPHRAPSPSRPRARSPTPLCWQKAFLTFCRVQDQAQSSFCSARDCWLSSQRWFCFSSDSWTRLKHS